MIFSFFLSFWCFKSPPPPAPKKDPTSCVLVLASPAFDVFFIFSHEGKREEGKEGKGDRLSVEIQESFTGGRLRGEDLKKWVLRADVKVTTRKVAYRTKKMFFFFKYERILPCNKWKKIDVPLPYACQVPECSCCFLSGDFLMNGFCRSRRSGSVQSWWNFLRDVIIPHPYQSPHPRTRGS